jgi:uncharacterized membrane protein
MKIIQSNPHHRYPRIDALRGIAILLMVIYHFCYDLTLFNLQTFDFQHHIFWLSFRTIIVTSFLGLVGFSLVLSIRHQRLQWKKTSRRLIVLALSATLVSVMSYVLFGERYIFFGILHFILLASLLGMLFLKYRWFNFWLGLVCLLLGILVQHPFFNQANWQWFGLMTHSPTTEDYVPFLPWFGIVLWGIFLGNQHINSQWVKTPLKPNWGYHYLTLTGQHSLLLYLIHQPILLALLFAVRWIFL